NVQYNWNNGSNDAKLTVSQPGEYAVTLNRGPFQASGSIVVAEKTASTSINDALLSGLSIFPNPVKDRVTLAWESNLEIEGTIRLYTPEGKTVLSRDVRSDIQEVQLETTQLASGLYFLQIPVAGTSVTRKLLVE
ncbi:MAG: T9SS type A sorting domain-containing protein, partial [Bacteroidota bacterium]